MNSYIKDRQQEQGQVVAEYALIFGLVVLAMVVGSTFVSQVQSQMKNARDTGVKLMIER